MAGATTKYIEIAPNDKEVLEILNSLNQEFGEINIKEEFNLAKLYQYAKQARTLLKNLETFEAMISNTIEKIQDFSTFQYSTQKNFVTYAAYVKKATLFVYEFRTWITQQEIQVVVQFENENKQLQYAQMGLKDLIPNAKLYLQKGKRTALATSKTKLQITNAQLQAIASDFILDNDVALRIGTFTKKAQGSARKAGYGTGRLFETVLENLANNINDINDKNFKWTIKDRIPALRAGDLSAQVTERLIELGILRGGSLKELEASLKTVSKSAQNTEIQNINQIKNELFNIVVMIEKSDPSLVKSELNKMFRNTSASGTAYQTRRYLANSLGIVVNGSLSDALDNFIK